jgi:succinoglycan biosynthesis transport protein ExoP
VAEEPENRQPDLRDYLQVLRRRKGTIILSVVAAGAIAFALSYAQTRVYEANAEVLIQRRPSERILTPDVNGSGVDPIRTIDTEIKVLQSRTVQDAVFKKLHRVPKVSATGAGETDVINVSVRDTNARQAARDANTYARTYIDVRRSQTVDDLLAAGKDVQAKVDDLQRQVDALPPFTGPGVANDQRSSLQSQLDYYRNQLGQIQVAAQINQTGGGQLITRAQTPGAPIEPAPLRNTAIALLLGLMVGVGLAFLREYLDESIKSKEDLERVAPGITTVGMIPMVDTWKDSLAPYLVTIRDPASPAAEAYRTLRTSIQFLGLDRPIKTLQVTSPAKEEGKTTTLTNLGVTLARAGSRVALLDCDLRRPRMHEFFGLSNHVGFTSVLLGECSLGDALQPVPGQSRLGLLASGPPPPEPSELLGSRHARGVLDALRASCDIVLIDTPPVLPVTDALVMARVVDGTLLVLAAGQTTKKGLHRAMELLEQVDTPLLGTVFNEVGSEQGYGAGYGYGYSYDPSSRASDGDRSFDAQSRSGRTRARASN